MAPAQAGATGASGASSAVEAEAHPVEAPQPEVALAGLVADVDRDPLVAHPGSGDHLELALFLQGGGVRRANQVAAVSVTRIGAQPSLPTAAEVRAFAAGTSRG